MLLSEQLPGMGTDEEESTRANLLKELERNNIEMYTDTSVWQISNDLVTIVKNNRVETKWSIWKPRGSGARHPL
jgi:NADH dehydrogenase FAD-containing subunit